jgi:hypothetical protein
MSTGAIIMMSIWMGGVTFMAVYFFYRVITAKPKKDSEDEKFESE